MNEVEGELSPSLMIKLTDEKKIHHQKHPSRVSIYILINPFFQGFFELIGE